MSVAPLNPLSSSQTTQGKSVQPSTPKTKTEDGFNFGEVLDILNPLQHIPGINTLYRKLTGDDASVRARMTGSALYGMIGGPLGMVSLVAGNMAEMKVEGALDKAQSSTAQSSMEIIDQKLSSEKIEPATDMARPLQRGIPVLPVAKRDIPSLFGNIASGKNLADHSTGKPIDAIPSPNTVTAKPQTDGELLPGIEKLSQDPRNLFTEETLARLRKLHSQTFSQRS